MRGALGIVLCVSGCAAGLRAADPIQAASSAKPKAIAISQFKFIPAELTVSVGDTVVWTNHDPLPHTTSADSGAWSSPEMARGERFHYVAARAGRFSYHCAAHSVMRGTLVVAP